MQRIFKYPIPTVDDFWLALPVGAQLLTVQAQRGEPVLWALVDDAAPLEQRRFMLRGTGHEAPGVGVYIGTFQLYEGAFVGHLFEAQRHSPPADC